MTPREIVIEAMARLIQQSSSCMRCPARSTEKVGPDCCQWDFAAVQLDALLSALPGLGLKVVPVEATKEQWDFVWVSCTSGHHPNITDKVSIHDLRAFFYEMARSFHELCPDALGGGK